MTERPSDVTGREHDDAARFERAVEAVVDGDVATLRALLHAQPSLASARSPRPHRATLLHYVAANGVEDERQRTPAAGVQGALAVTLVEHGAALAWPGPGSTSAPAGHAHVVRLLVERGARLDLVDTIHQGTPQDWAEHAGQGEIAAYLRSARESPA